MKVQPLRGFPVSTTHPPAPSPREGVTRVRPLRGFRVMTMPCRFAVLCGLTFFAAPAPAMDLLQAYRLAAEADAGYQAARAAAEAAREAIPQARAALLPVVSMSSSRSKSDTHQESQTVFGPRSTDYKNYEGKSDVLSLKQPLFRMGSFIAYGQAQEQVAAAEATLAHETQLMALRVSGAYFDVLQAQERLDSIRSQKAAYAGQLDLSERAFKAGEGTRTDIDEARSRLLLVSAQEIEAQALIDKAERSLAAVINRSVPAAALAGLEPARMALAAERPDGIAEWIALAEEGNHELRALRHQLEAASSEVAKTRAQHLPTLDLVATRSDSLSETSNTIGSSYRTSSIGVQLNLPLFAGGSVLSATRQALANEERVRQQLEAARRQLAVNVATEFNGVHQGIARVRAFEAAVGAATQAVASTRKGIQAGTRNTVDVLNAEQQLAGARSDLAKARYDYVMARLKLKAAAGMLAEADVERISGWLRAR